MARNVRGRFAVDVPAWRRAASVAWNAPNDPTVSGALEIDATRALAYVRELARASGERVTITHLVIKAVAHALARHPECNAFVRRRRIFRRDDVDVFVLVALQNGESEPSDADLAGLKLGRADRLDVVETAAQLGKGVRALRSGEDPAFGLAKSLVRTLPPLVSAVGLKLVSYLQYELNLDLSSLGVPRDSFGSALVTNVGMFGIGQATAPLIPLARFATVVVIGRIEDRPVAENGQVVIRPILPLQATFDHRVVDGFHGGRLAQTLRAALTDPEAVFGPARVACSAGRSDD